MLGFRTLTTGLIGGWWRQRWYGLAFGNNFIGVQTAAKVVEEVL